MRYIAGLPYNVVLDDEYNKMAQAACLVMAASGDFSHTPKKPSDMDDELYQLGYQGASSSNIGWGHTSMTHDIVHGWLADSGDNNLDTVGHRRWILYPRMGKIGFGYVNRYSAMYSFDDSGTGSQYGVVWPAQNMPLEYFKANYPWSYSAGYTLDEAAVTVSVERESDHKTWNFSSAASDGHFTVNNDNYGQPGCVIFRPDGITAFASDDVFHVLIKQGSYVVAEYDVNFFSMNPVTEISLSKTEISFDNVGDTESLNVSQVVPASASTGIIWTSTDDKVVKVEPGASGSRYAAVTAVGTGEAQIIAVSTNGRVQAVCTVKVHSFVEQGLVNNDTQMKYVCDDCNEVMYKNVITSIGRVFWRVGEDDNFNYPMKDEPEADVVFEMLIKNTVPTDHDDSLVVTTDREDILTFTQDTGYSDIVYSGIPQRAGEVEITISSKLNPEVKQSHTVYVHGPLIIDSLTADTDAVTEEGGVCGIPVILKVEAAGGKQPYTITYTAIDQDGGEEIIAADSQLTMAKWVPSAEGVYTLKAAVKDANGTVLEQTLDHYKIRKAAVSQSTAAPVSFADQDAALAYGQVQSSVALNTETAVFIGEANEEVKGTLAWESESTVLSTGEQSLTWIFIPDNEDAYERCTGQLTADVQKAVPVISVQAASLTNDHYDSERTLADEQILGTAQITYNGETQTIDGTFVWMDEDTVPAAGTESYAVKFIPADSEHIAEAESEIALTILKAKPVRREGEETVIRELTYGQTLSDYSAEVFSVYEKASSTSALRGTFAWESADTMPAVQDSMTTQYTVVFTPDDPNFEPYSEGVYVRVNKAVITVRPEAVMEVPYQTETAGMITLPEGWYLDRSDLDKALEVDTPLNITAWYMDQMNYENPTQTIQITRQPCAHTDVREITDTEAACTEDGMGMIFCNICDEMLEEYTIPAKGHTEEADPAVEAACTKTGLTAGSHCAVCGEVIKAQEIIPAKGHTEEADPAVEATCTQTGLTEGSHCSVCGEVLKAQEIIPAKGHAEEVIDAAVEATCTQTGLTEGSHCSVCDEVIKAQEIVPTIAHTPEVIPGREATESESGLTEGSRCAVCGTVITAQQEIPKKTSAGNTEESQSGSTVPTAPTVPTVVTGEVSPQNPVTSEAVENQVLRANSDSDQKGSAFALLQARGTASSSTSVKLTWKRVSGATKYIVYGNKCGKNNRYKKIKTVTGTKYTQKKLKKGTYYKYLVVAVNGDKALAVSKTIHVATKGGKVGNSKKVKLSRSSVKVSVKKTIKIKASAVAESTKRKVKKHRALAYESSNPSVATVSKKGVVKGVAKGTCYVYVYAQNGVYGRVKVTVK